MRNAQVPYVVRNCRRIVKGKPLVQLQTIRRNGRLGHMFWSGGERRGSTVQTLASPQKCRGAVGAYPGPHSIRVPRLGEGLLTLFIAPMLFSASNETRRPHE